MVISIDSPSFFFESIGEELLVESVLFAAARLVETVGATAADMMICLCLYVYVCIKVLYSKGGEVEIEMGIRACIDSSGRRRRPRQEASGQGGNGERI